MVDLLEDFVGPGLHHAEVHEQPGFVELIPHEIHFHLPVMSMQSLTFAVEIFQAVRRGKLGGRLAVSLQRARPIGGGGEELEARLAEIDPERHQLLDARFA